MGLIAIENVRFFAHHGVYEEEKICGNEFEVNVYVEVDLDSSTRMEDLSQTLNYETIFLCCKKVMGQPQDLLETVCIDLVKSLKAHFPALRSIKVNIRKFNPMPGERVGSSFIEIEENFKSKCSACGNSFSCYKDNTCWCFDQELSEETRKVLKDKYKGCLCPECLKQFTVKK